MILEHREGRIKPSKLQSVTCLTFVAVAAMGVYHFMPSNESGFNDFYNKKMILRELITTQFKCNYPKIYLFSFNYQQHISLVRGKDHRVCFVGILFDFSFYFGNGAF